VLLLADIFDIFVSVIFDVFVDFFFVFDVDNVRVRQEKK